MSLFRPSSLFGFPDLDTFPFGGGLGGRGSAGAAGFPGALLAPSSDYFRNDNMWAGPKVDIHETDQAYAVTAELPGIKKEDVNVKVDAERRRLTIEGQIKSEYTSGGGADLQQQEGAGDATASTGKERTENGGDKSASKEVASKVEGGKVGHPLVSERIYGSFSRSFTLPINANLADEKGLKARFQDGLLKLEIPKKSEEITKSRQIAIE